MKEQLVVSKEQLVASIEEGLNHATEQPKPVEVNSWQQKIQILKFILYFELVLFTAWLFYSAWQSYQVQYGEIKVIDGDLIIRRSNLLADAGTPQHWTNDPKRSKVDDGLPDENIITSFDVIQTNAQVDSGNGLPDDENKFIEQIFEAPRRIDPDIEKLFFSPTIDTDSINSQREEKLGKSDFTPLTLEELIKGLRMNRDDPYDDQSKGGISILGVEDTKVLSSEPKSIWFPKIVQDDYERKVNPFSDNPNLRNMNAQILYLETQGDDEAFLKRLISGDQTSQEGFRNILTNQDRTSQMNTYDELPQTIFETSDENLQRYFKHSNPDAQKYFDRKSQGSDFSDNIDQVLDEMTSLIAKRIESSRKKEEVQDNEGWNEFVNRFANREMVEEANKNDAKESELMVPEYRKSEENYEIMLPFGMSWITSDDVDQSKDSSDEKSLGTGESTIPTSEEPTTIKSDPDDLLMTTYWSLFFPDNSAGKSSESNSQETLIPASDEQTTTKDSSPDSSSLEWFMDFPFMSKFTRKIQEPSEESSAIAQSQEKSLEENPWFAFLLGQSKEDSTTPSTEEEVKEDSSSTDLEKSFKPEDCQLINIQNGFKVYDCSHPKSTKQIIDEPNPIVWDESYKDYMYTDDYEDSGSSSGGVTRMIAPTPEIPLGNDKMIEEDLASMRKQDSVSAQESMEGKEEEEEKEEEKKEKVLQRKNNRIVSDSLWTSREEAADATDSQSDDAKASSASGASVGDESSQQVDTVTTPKPVENGESDESNSKSQEGTTSDVSSEAKPPSRSQPNPYLSPYVVDNSSPNREDAEEADPDLKYEAVMRSLDIVKFLGFTKEKNPEYNQILNKIYSECVEELSGDNSWREGNDEQPTANQVKICVRGASLDDEKLRPIWHQKLSFVHDMEDAGTVENLEKSEYTKKDVRKTKKFNPDSTADM